MIREIDSRRAHPAPVSARAVATQAAAAVRAFSLNSLILFGMASLAVATPAQAAKPAKQKFSTETPLTPFQPPITEASTFSFTASGGNAANARLQTVERAFRFTPSGQADNRKALSIGLNARVVAPSVDRSRAAPPADVMAAAPRAYNVDLSVGWKGFAVNTGFSQVEPAPTALLTTRSETIDVGVSYRGKNWKTSLQGSSETGGLLAQTPLQPRYSVEFGGAYSIAPRVSVRGGVRYKLAPETPSLLDAERDDQAVYVGTNVAF
jgi:hypothetical protein